MKKFVIDCNMPGVGSFDQTKLKSAAATSKEALAKLSSKVQWLQSYVVNKTFCI